jgi:O-antigen/teichoic acid export membrane protein
MIYGKVKVMAHLIGLKIKNSYILTRGISAFLALLFSFYYSKNLGVEKRSLVTLILVVVVIVMVALASGVGLTFRKYSVSNPDFISLSAYLYTNLILGVLVSGFSILFLQIFSTSRVPIPTTLLFLAAIYAFLGTLDFNLHQGLIAFGMFKIAAILDLLTVTIQISIYFLFSLSNQISIASSLFTSLIISYVTSVVATVIALLVHTNASIVPKWKDIRLLFKSSIPFHVVGIANGFADRIDRIAIAWFLPLATLGKFAVGTSILSYLRFIPEAFSRLIVGGQSKFQVNASRFVGKSWLNRLFIGTFLSISLAIVSQALIWLVLGKQWLIPFVVVLGFSVQELIRGYFQLRMSELVSAGKENIVARLSVHLIVISAVLSILGVRLAGLIGVPIGIAVAYLILLLFSYKAPYKVTK